MLVCILVFCSNEFSGYFRIFLSEGYGKYAGWYWSGITHTTQSGRLAWSEKKPQSFVHISWYSRKIGTETKTLLILLLSTKSIFSGVDFFCLFLKYRAVVYKIVKYRSYTLSDIGAFLRDSLRKESRFTFFFPRTIMQVIYKALTSLQVSYTMAATHSSCMM